MWWNCLKSHRSSFLLLLVINSRSDHGRWFPNEKSIKERHGVIWRKHRGGALKLSWNSSVWFAKNFHKCFSCRGVVLAKGMVWSQFLESARGREQLPEAVQRSKGNNIREGSNCAAQGHLQLRSPFWGSVGQPRTHLGYAETLRGSVGSASPILELRNPLQVSAEARIGCRGWHRGFRVSTGVSRAKI